MNIWRVKSKTGTTVHLTFDREKTFCNRVIGDNWKFLFLLNDRTEAMEHVDGLCEKCNTINLKEWEKEWLLNGNDKNKSIEEYGQEPAPSEFKPVKSEAIPVRGKKV